MKKSSILAMIGLVLTITHAALAQEKSKKEINIGGTFPETNVLNRMPESKTFTSYKEGYSNGLMIINFWATWCVPCVREMTELSKLSARFNNKLTVVSVTHESAEVARTFFRKHPEIDLRNITVLTSDKTLISYFPHRFLPHNVWVDSKGNVAAITGSEDISENKISQVLQNKKPVLREKKDLMDFDYFKPYKAPDSLSIFRAIFSRSQSGISSGTTFKEQKESDPGMRFFTVNCPIGMIYWCAFYRELNASQVINPHFIEFKNADSLLMKVPKDISKTSYKTKADWVTANCYTYELSYSKRITEEKFFNKMKSDLFDYFGYRAALESRKKMSQIIRLSEKSKPIPKSSGNEKSFQITASGLSMSNMTIKELIGGINQFFIIAEPLIDETNISYPIDLELKNLKPKEGINMVKILKLLEKKGLTIVRKKRKVKVLVIADQN